MPTIFTHAAAGAALAQCFAPAGRIKAFTWAAAGAAMLPDADAAAFWLGVHGGLLGHRGWTHSLFFAGLVAAGAALLWPLERRERWRAAACIFAATASHGVLDAFTDGGSGVAFLAPFNGVRYFWPVTPVRVAPMRPAALFSAWGAAVMASELAWVWAPAAVVALAARVLRGGKRGDGG